MIAVTGASGLIGNVLVRELLARGEPVRAITHSAQHEISLAGLEVEKVSLDITDAAALRRAFKGADTIYHLAAMVSLSRFRARAMYRVNLRGTQAVIQACRDCGVRRLVYAGSVDALVLPRGCSMLDETAELAPERIAVGYGRSKARATVKVLEAAQQGFDAVIVSPSSVVGPFDFKPTQIGQAMIEFVNGRFPAYLDGGYDFVDVRDVVQGMILVAEKGRSGENYILSGQALSLHEFMLILQELTGRRAPRFKVPLWLAKTVVLVAPVYYGLRRAEPIFSSYSLRVVTENCPISSAKARKELGYTSRPLKETLRDTVEWFRAAGRL